MTVTCECDPSGCSACCPSVGIDIQDTILHIISLVHLFVLCWFVWLPVFLFLLCLPIPNSVEKLFLDGSILVLVATGRFHSQLGSLSALQPLSFPFSHSN